MEGAYLHSGTEKRLKCADCDGALPYEGGCLFRKGPLNGDYVRCGGTVRQIPGGELHFIPELEFHLFPETVGLNEVKFANYIFNLSCPNGRIELGYRSLQFHALTPQNCL